MQREKVLKQVTIVSSFKKEDAKKLARDRVWIQDLVILSLPYQVLDKLISFEILRDPLHGENCLHAALVNNLDELFMKVWDTLR